MKLYGESDFQINSANNQTCCVALPVRKQRQCAPHINLTYRIDDEHEYQDLIAIFNDTFLGPFNTG